MKKFFVFALAIIGVVACLNLSSCSKDDKEEPSNSLVGTWRLSLNFSDGHWFYCQFDFKANGTWEGKDWGSGNEPSEYEYDGTYSISNNLLRITFNEEDGSTYTEEYIFDLNGDTLTLYDYEEPGPNIFRRI